MKVPAEAVDRIEHEVRQRSLERALARQERGLPITRSWVHRIVRDEARRARDRFVAALPN
jgi:hypothetical protein